LRAQRVGPEAAPLGRPRAQRLDEDVGALGQAQERREPVRVREVEGERALARVRAQEHDALAVPGRPPLPRLVARVGPLDLDDVRAERAQDLGAVRTGERRGDVEHAEAVERQEAHGAIVWRRGVTSV
jgi:hypothetical protein